MNPVQQTSTISSPCYETIFIFQSFSADTKNVGVFCVVLQVDKGPVGLGTTLKVAKQKFLAKNPSQNERLPTTAHQKPSAQVGHLTNIHKIIGNHTKLTPCFFFDKAPRSSNKIQHHQPPGPPATQPFKGKPPSLGVFQSARHKLSCTTTITGRLTQLPGMTRLDVKMPEGGGETKVFLLVSPAPPKKQT